MSQSPTDHYEIPALMEKVLNNLNGIKPAVVSEIQYTELLLMQLI